MFESMKINSLAKMLQSPDREKRLLAIQSLAKIKDASVVNPLINALGHEALYVRQVAIEALGALGDTRAVQPLINMLNDTLNTIRYTAAKALGSLRDQSAVDPLITMLNDEDKHVRFWAADSLGALGDPRAVDSLIKALCESDKEVRKHAAEILAKLGEPKWKEYVIGNTDDFTKLGQSKEPLAIDILIRAIQNKDATTRMAAVKALGDFKDPMYVELLSTAMMSDNDWHLRAEAAKAISQINDPQVTEHLCAALVCDENIDVRMALIEILAKMKDIRAVEPIISILAEGVCVQEASEALSELLHTFDGSQFVYPLIKALESRNNDAKIVVSSFLGILNDQRAVEPLIQALIIDNINVRTAVAEALDKLGEPKWKDFIAGESYVRIIEKSGSLDDPRIISPLIKAIKNNECPIRVATAQSLGMKSDPRAVKALNEALSGSDLYVRVEAARVLSRQHIPQAIEVLINFVSSNIIDQDLIIIAAQALGELGDHPDRSRFATSLRLIWYGNTNVNKQETVIKALGRLSDPNDIEFIIHALDHNNTHIRAAAAEALGNFCDSRIVEPLLKVLKKNDNDEVWINAAKSLGAQKDPRIIPTLVNTLDLAVGSRCHDAVFEILGNLKDPRAVEPLIELLFCKYPGAKLYAIKLLVILQDPRAVQPLIDVFVSGPSANAAQALGKLHDLRAVNSLECALSSESGGVRKAAALAVIEIAKYNSNYNLFEHLSSDLLKQISTPHADSHFDSDWSSHHTDTGIGIDIQKLIG